MLSEYKGKAIAGTLKVSKGWRLLSENVKNHFSKTSTTANPEFKEIVGFTVVAESWNFNKAYPLEVTYNTAP